MGAALLYGFGLGIIMFGGFHPFFIIQGILYAALLSWTALRFGFLAVVVGSFFRLSLVFFPWTLDLSAWYAARTFPPILVLGGLLVFGFVTAIGGRSLFRDPLEES